MLKISNLTKRYGEKLAVDNLSLSIAPGEIYGFIGHNGAGKTTTLKCAAGILGFDAGEIAIDGISVKDAPIEAKKRLAYIPDNPDLYNFMSGIKYLNFISDVFGVEKSERERLIRGYSSRLSLTDELANPINSYSHGMKQKLAVISALVHSPRLLMLDEPFVGLDPSATFTLKQILREICDGGGAVFFSTHILEVAEKLCDKVAIIQNGRLVTSGVTEEVTGNTSLEHVFLELVDSHG